MDPEKSNVITSPWAADAQSVLQHFDVVREKGLKNRQVARFVKLYGLNQLRQVEKAGLAQILLNQVKSLIVILLAVAGLLGIKLYLQRQSFFKAWFASSLVIVSATFFGVIGLFPNLLPSNINPEFSLNAFNASSSPLTLKIMLVVVLLFIPVVLVYQFWAYNLFKTKISLQEIELGEAY